MQNTIFRVGFILLFMVLAGHVHASPVGRFTALHGQVDLTRPGAPAQSVNTGDPVEIGDIIRVKSKSRAEVAFVDGNILRVAENTRLQISEYMLTQERTGKTLRLFRGKLQNLVKSLPAEGKYEVHTPNSVIGVRGTDFFVYHQAGVSGGVFLEGRGYSYSLNRPQEIRLVQAGQAVTIPGPSQVPVVRPATPAEMQRHQKDTEPPPRPKEEKKAAAEEKRTEAPKPEVQTAAQTGTKPESVPSPPAQTVQAAVVLPEPAPAPPPPEILPVSAAAALLAAPAITPPTAPLIPVTDLDTRPPSLSLVSAPGAITGSIEAGFVLKTDEPAAFAFRLDGGSWRPMAGSTLDLAELAEGAHTIDFQAQDKAGNLSPVQSYTWFIGRRHYTLVGNMAGGSFAGRVGEASPGLRLMLDGNLGAWALAGSGTYSEAKASLRLWAGGSGADDAGKTEGYWMNKMDLALSDGFISGTSSLVYLTPYRFGNGQGTVRGSYGSGAWQITDFNPGTYTEKPLSFSSVLKSGGIYGTSLGTFREREYRRFTNPLWPYKGGDAYRGDEYNAGYFRSGGANILGYNNLRPEGGKGSLETIFYPDQSATTWTLAPPQKIATYATWADAGVTDLTALLNPPSTGYQLVYEEEWATGSAARLGNFHGIMGGSSNPWTATPGSPAALVLLGGFDRTALSFLFDTSIQNTYSPAGGAYAGFLSGSVSGENLDGRVLALYIDPSGGAGVLRGNFNGAALPEFGVWQGSGSIHPVAFNAAGMAAAAADLNAHLVWGAMRLDRTSGSFAGESGSRLGRMGAGFGATLSIDGRDWGIFRLFHAFDNYYRNPLNGSQWKADFTGAGEFGTFLAATGKRGDAGFWLAHAPPDSSWHDGRLYGRLSGRFLTLTAMGTLEGEILGTYTPDANVAGFDGTYQGISLGTWQKTRALSFSSPIRGMSYSLSRRTSGTYSYANGGLYNFSYDNRTGQAYTFLRDATSHTETRRYFHLRGTERALWYDEWVHDELTHELLKSSSSAYGSSLSDLAVNPRPDWGAPVFLKTGLEPLIQTSGDAQAIMGGWGDLWRATEGGPAGLTFLGNSTSDAPQYSLLVSEVKSYNAAYEAPTTPDGGAYRGYMGRVAAPGGGITGRVYALYIDPGRNAGILTGTFNGMEFPQAGAWEAEGTIFPVPLTSGPIPTAPADLHNQVAVTENWQNFPQPFGTFAAGGNLTSEGAYRRISLLNGQPFGIWQTVEGGTYSAAVSDSWVSITTSFDPNGEWYTDVLGTSWNAGIIAGKVSGAAVRWAEAKTYVTGGELMGTFDPAAATWQALSMGAMIETGKFMEMAATPAGRAALEKLNIPCVEVGRADLSGSAGGLQVNMKNVTFFRYATGSTDPRIWATQNVTGTYTSLPAAGTNVPLSGGGLSADFRVQQWGNSKWGAQVQNGAGILMRTGGGTVNINFSGAAAGAYGGGSFNGTGAGTVKRP